MVNEIPDYVDLTTDKILYIQAHNVEYGLVSALEGQFEGPKLGIRVLGEDGEEAIRFVVSKDTILDFMAFVYAKKEVLFPKRGTTK